jgi:geranylgeranyl pyrophosphate synthase
MASHLSLAGITTQLRDDIADLTHTGRAHGMTFGL